MISFWRTSDPYGWLSNFSRHSVVIDGVSYPTTEHYFQAQKFLSPVERQQVISQPTPMLAKIKGVSRTFTLRSDWEEIKENIMLIALRAKIEQHPSLKTKLLATGTKLLAEDSPNDSYWGLGKNRQGLNRLGILWMQVREELKP